MNKATLNDTISVPENVLFQEVEGTAVLMNLESGTYFGIDATGTRMWTCLTKYGLVMPAYLDLLDDYDVSEAQLGQDLLQLIDTLAANGLLQIHSASQLQP